MIVDRREHKCSDCNSRNIHEDDVRGEIVCHDCGLIIEEAIVDAGAEWRVYSNSKTGDKGIRAGEKQTHMLHDRGLSTTIAWEDRDYAGKGITFNRSQMYRLRKWQKRSRISNASERNLSVALAEMGRLCSQMSLPKSLAESASELYRKANEMRLCRGRSIDAIVAASVYIACRIENIPRTLDEVSNASRTGRKEIGRTSRMMQRQLKLRLFVPQPMAYNSRFCSMLKLSAETEARSYEIQQQLIDNGFDVGRGPVSICASSIYIAAKLTHQPRTQREIAETAGITEVTVRHRYKEILELLKIELPHNN